MTYPFQDLVLDVQFRSKLTDSGLVLISRYVQLVLGTSVCLCVCVCVSYAAGVLHCRSTLVLISSSLYSQIQVRSRFWHTSQG